MTYIKLTIAANMNEVLSNPPTPVTLGGVKGNEGVIQPTDVSDFGVVQIYF